MDVRAFCHEETYRREGLEALIDAYDRTMAAYLQEIGREKEVDWSTATAAFYDGVYFPDVLASAREQGFELDK
jgi:FMN reductase [NAD(P)H]